MIGLEGVVSFEPTTERRKFNNLSRCSLVGEKGDEWTNGTTVLRVEEVSIQGPRMWFTGPWKPGYITVLSSRKNFRKAR